MELETDIQVGEHVYRAKRLPFRIAQKAIDRLFLADDRVPVYMTEDAMWFEEHIFGEYLCVQGEQGQWIPLGSKLVAAHFEHRYLDYQKLLDKVLGWQFADFLAAGRSTDRTGANTHQRRLEFDPQS